MNRQQIYAVVFGVQLDDMDKPLLVAETGDAAFQRILDDQLFGN
jgi:hypothetical protein